MNYSSNNPSAERPAIIEDIRASIRGIRTPPPLKRRAAPEPPDFSEAHLLFTVCTGNRWMELGERLPAPKRLFGDFWHQNELCILFAAANAGKSILAVQIADALSRGRAAAPFAPRYRRPLNVLYIDFELSTTQFHTRYSRQGAAYQFSDKFFRAEFNHDPSLCPSPALYDDFVIAAIEQKITLVNARVLIIDNLSCLRGGTENASVALRLMKNLKALQASHNLSILVLAHTPKRRSHSRPVTADDLHGSKLLINFADSAFTIGASDSQSGLCYVKQIKQRNTEQLYGDNNVCLCRIARRHDNFLRFKFEGYSAEASHLPGYRAGNAALAAKVAALSARGFSQRRISKKLGISLGLVNKLVRKSEKSESPKVRKVKDVQMCGYADVRKMEDEVQMCKCADVQMIESDAQLGDSPPELHCERSSHYKPGVRLISNPLKRHCEEQLVQTKFGKANLCIGNSTKRYLFKPGVRLTGDSHPTGPLISMCSPHKIVGIVPRNDVPAVSSG